MSEPQIDNPNSKINFAEIFDKMSDRQLLLFIATAITSMESNTETRKCLGKLAKTIGELI